MIYGISLWFWGLPMVFSGLMGFFWVLSQAFFEVLYFWVSSQFFWGFRVIFGLFSWGFLGCPQGFLGAPHGFLWDLLLVFGGSAPCDFWDLVGFFGVSLWFLGSPHGLLGYTHVFLVSSCTFQLPIFHPLLQPSPSVCVHLRIPMVLPGQNFQSSIKLYLWTKFLARQKIGLRVVTSMSPTFTRQSTTSRAPRVGIHTPCNQNFGDFGVCFPLKVEFWDFEVEV